MARFRCDWCGRFYSSPLPEGSACDRHIHDHNIRQREQIRRFNARLSPAAREAGTSGSDSLVSDGDTKNLPPRSPQG